MPRHNETVITTLDQFRTRAIREATQEVSPRWRPCRFRREEYTLEQDGYSGSYHSGPQLILKFPEAKDMWAKWPTTDYGAFRGRKTLVGILRSIGQLGPSFTAQVKQAKQEAAEEREATRLRVAKSALRYAGQQAHLELMRLHGANLELVSSEISMAYAVALQAVNTLIEATNK